MKKEDVTKEIQRFVEIYKNNVHVKTEWGVPLVGYASADDPFFEELKKIVIESHAVPKDLLPGAKTVISFFLPFPQSVSRSNTGEGYSSPEWAISYIETNELIGSLSDHLSTFMEATGERAVGIPATHNWLKEKLISNWSHRHVAFIAGLGRFGINNMLITDKGCSGRIGSLVTTAEFPADNRPDVEACLYKHDGSCRKCIRKCVIDALDENSFDRTRCYAKLLENVEEHKNLGYADVCGKCLTAVPCTHTNPVKVKQKAQNRKRGE